MNSLVRSIFIVFFLGLAGCSYKNIDSEQKSKDSKAAGYNVQLGIAYLEKGEIERAKRKLLIAEKQDPKSEEVKVALAYFWEYTKNYKFAEREYLKALGLRKKSGMIHNNYGAFLCKMDRFKEADDQYNLAVDDQNYTKTADVYENAGMCAKKAGKLDKAKQYFEKAVNNDNTKIAAILSLMEINYDSGKCRDAEDWKNVYEERHEHIADSLVLSYRIAHCLGQSAKKKRYFTKLKQHFPAQIKRL